jgi:hypothetical protein
VGGEFKRCNVFGGGFAAAVQVPGHRSLFAKAIG